MLQDSGAVLQRRLCSPPRSLLPNTHRFEKFFFFFFFCFMIIVWICAASQKKRKIPFQTFFNLLWLKHKHFFSIKNGNLFPTYGFPLYVITHFKKSPLCFHPLWLHSALWQSLYHLSVFCHSCLVALKRLEFLVSCWYIWPRFFQKTKKQILVLVDTTYGLEKIKRENFDSLPQLQLLKAVGLTHQT